MGKSKGLWKVVGVGGAALALVWTARVWASNAPAGSAGKIYCNVHGLTPAQRSEHDGLMAKVKAAVLETHELDDGFAFRVDGGKLSLAEAGRWIELERRCCPFFHFALEIEPDGGPTWLRLSGAPGVKAFLQTTLAGG
jgi:hypothetical protein